MHILQLCARPSTPQEDTGKSHLLTNLVVRQDKDGLSKSGVQCQLSSEASLGVKHPFMSFRAQMWPPHMLNMFTFSIQT